MNKQKIITACTCLLTALFINSCDMDIVTGNTRSFDNNLQGTWVPNDPDALYKGSLKIEYDRITITGYGESQTPSGGNDNNRPFKNFSKGIALKGYSEEGKIFIEDGGLLQEGIPYTYWENSLSYGYNNEKLLRFTFDGRDETLQKQ